MKRTPTPEAGFQASVTEFLTRTRWTWVHFRKSLDPRRGGQWRTAQDGQKGFPDIFALRPNPRLGLSRCLAIELKGIDVNGRPGKMDEGQRLWSLLLSAVNGIEWYCWWPDDWDEIERILK